MNKGIEDITNMINMILPSWKMRPERKVFSQILHCIRIILNRFQQPEDEILVSYDVTSSVHQNTFRRNHIPHLRPNIQTTQTAPHCFPSNL